MTFHPRDMPKHMKEQDVTAALKKFPKLADAMKKKK